MTQKEQVLQELTRAGGGLTTVELRARTRLPEASLRTIMWEMRRDGWVEPVGGVRGRYKYGVTDVGRRQAPDAVAETIFKGLGVFPAGSGFQRSPDPAEVAQRLLAFVHWLSRERSDLFPEDAPDLESRLETAVVDFLYGDVDVIRALLDRLSRGKKQ